VSSGEALDEIRRARSRGAVVFAETCPQYLLLTAEETDRPGFEGAKFMCSPPLRDKASQDELWKALADGSIQVVASDHAPYRYDDPAGKRAHGEQAPFTQVPNGVPGLETRLPLLFSEGVNKGRIDLNRFVALTATTPARLFGLHPRKGTIAVGSDADVLVYDPNRKRTISAKTHHMDCDYSCYEGREIQGGSDVVISRGTIVWKDGEFLGRKGHGTYLKRDRADWVRKN
jgi:dihydropyrimidinase